MARGERLRAGPDRGPLVGGALARPASAHPLRTDLRSDLEARGHGGAGLDRPIHRDLRVVDLPGDANHGSRDLSLSHSLDSDLEHLGTGDEQARAEPRIAAGSRVLTMSPIPLFTGVLATLLASLQMLCWIAIGSIFVPETVEEEAGAPAMVLIGSAITTAIYAVFASRGELPAGFGL